MKKKKQKVAICACLLGIPCNYKAEKKVVKKAWDIFRKNQAIIVCPELLAGLEAPRESCETVGGDGQQVLAGQAKVLSKTGRDYTKQYLKGSAEAIDMIKKFGAKKVYLQPRSPSCGLTKVYSGEFNGLLVKGSGVFAARLKKEKIKCEEIKN